MESPKKVENEGSKAKLPVGSFQVSSWFCRDLSKTNFQQTNGWKLENPPSLHHS